MKLTIFSLLLVGAAVAAPAEPTWKYTSRDFNDTNATVPHTPRMHARDSGHANLPRLPFWNRQFRNNTANPNGNVARNTNLTLPVTVTLKERSKELSTKREADFPKFGAY
ncbi:hypothetical protein QBC33DRAFT_511694 [Phialemonium atrogriseum]|uniref:Uncharacterized protein n=1 Tax=Phialemonium atrogriseum TaxID=1093897 RepID=A0AAJ0C920_9PEZI|nr:uncharacterized protein QBC33DRAFT_511694 [Phialemonium atrogriseum]KAK1770884.1 hypothetical protein QBC33DRAFT_511694 [Phialemonium atrogriseum]